MAGHSPTSIHNPPPPPRLRRVPKTHTSPISFALKCRYPNDDSDYLGESEGEAWRAVKHFLSAPDADKIQALRAEDPESHQHPPHPQGVTKGFPRAD